MSNECCTKGSKDSRGCPSPLNGSVPFRPSFVVRLGQCHDGTGLSCTPNEQNTCLYCTVHTQLIAVLVVVVLVVVLVHSFRLECTAPFQFRPNQHPPPTISTTTNRSLLHHGNDKATVIFIVTVGLVVVELCFERNDRKVQYQHTIMCSMLQCHDG